MKLNIGGISNKDISKYLAQAKFISLSRLLGDGWTGIGTGTYILSTLYYLLSITLYSILPSLNHPSLYWGGRQNEFKLVNLQLFLFSDDCVRKPIYLDLYNGW